MVLTGVHMKISVFQKILAVVVAMTWLAASALSLQAQDAGMTNAPGPAMGLTPTPPLSPPTLQVLQLAQAKVSEGTILAFVKGSQANYNLDAPAIIFLRQQGVTDAVLTAMLTPPVPVVATNLPLPQPATASPPTPVPAAPDPQLADASGGQATDPTGAVPPDTTYVEVLPPDPVVIYYQNFYQTYGYYPPVYYSVGVHGNYHNGGNGGYHGGNNGYHGGGNNGGGNNGGYHGGGNYGGANNGGGNNSGHGGYIGNAGGYAAPHH
jgi:hypothetical protein